MKFFITNWKWWLLALLLLGGALALLEQWRLGRENRHDRLILATARQYGVDPALVKAVVWRESKFDPRARGRAGEVGLMQVRAEAAGEWARAEGRRLASHTDLLDPGRNLQAGTWYLRKVLRRYAQTDNPMAYALADYNAGRTRVLNWNKGPAATNSAAFLREIDFPATRDYIRSVLRRCERYHRQFAQSTFYSPNAKIRVSNQTQ